MSRGARAALLSLLPALLAAAPEPAAAGAPADGETLLIALRRGADGKTGFRPHLVRVGADGKEASASLLARRLAGLRATAAGTLLGWDDASFGELTRDGRTLWEVDTRKGAAPGWDLGHRRIASADPLANGNALVLCFPVRMTPEQEKESSAAAAGMDGADMRDIGLKVRRIRAQGATVVEATREGKIVRKLDLPVPAQSVRAAGDGTFLAIEEEGARELDWKGNEIRLLPRPGKGQLTDALRTPDGGWLYCFVDNSTGSKTGAAVEADAAGKALRTVRHGCPATVQPLPGGGLLVGGG